MLRRNDSRAEARPNGLLVGATLARQTGRANAADITEQLLEEAALAAQRRGLLARRFEVHHQFLAGVLDRGDIALLVEADDHHRLLPDAGVAERDLVDVAGDVIPVVRAELADKARPAERLFNRILIVDARLDRAGHLGIEDDAFVLTHLRAARQQHRRRNG